MSLGRWQFAFGSSSVQVDHALYPAEAGHSLQSPDLADRASRVHSLQEVQKRWWNSDTIDRPQRPFRGKMSAATSDRGADASRLGTEGGQDEVSTGGGGRLG